MKILLKSIELNVAVVPSSSTILKSNTAASFVIPKPIFDCVPSDNAPAVNKFGENSVVPVFAAYNSVTDVFGTNCCT